MPKNTDHNVFPFDLRNTGSRIAGESAFAEAMHHVNTDLPIGESLARGALLEVLECQDESQGARLGALLVGSCRVATPEMIKGLVGAVSEFEGKDLSSLDKPSVNFGDGIVVGCAGSGKKGKKTINISTPAMIVAAAAGAKTLKAGSRSASSVTGSTDILESVGFVVPDTEYASTRILQETDFGFYSIEHHVPRFDSVYGNKFFAPHSLSFVLPALLIPVKVDTLLYGYAGPNVGLSSRAFAALGKKSVMVCTNTADGVHYIDEMATVGVTSISGVNDGVVGSDLRFDACEYLGIKNQKLPLIDSKMTVREQSEIFKSVLSAEFPDSYAEKTICLNAATLLYLAKKCQSPVEGFEVAVDTIRSGRAYEKLLQIVKVSQNV